MITKDNIINYIISNKKTFAEKYHINKIGIIGSFARGEENNNSDIDLIIEFDTQTNDIFDIKLKLSEIFKKQFNRNVDIAREKYLKPRVKDLILKETIYVK